MKNIMPVIIVIVVIVVLLGVSGALYTIDETQQVVITQFGKPIGRPITIKCGNRLSEFSVNDHP